MPRDLAMPDSLAAQLRELDRRVHTLERTPRTAEGRGEAVGLEAAWVQSGFKLYSVTTTGSWKKTFYASFPDIQYNCLEVVAHVFCPAGTVADVVLTVLTPQISIGTLYDDSGIGTVTGEADAAVKWVWEHGVPASSGPMELVLRVMRTSGSGSVDVTCPTTVVQRQTAENDPDPVISDFYYAS